MKSALLSIIFTLSCFYLSAQTNTSGLVFDGIDDLDSIPNSSGLLEGATAMSLTAWVKPLNSAPSYPNFDAFAGYKNEAQSDFYMIQIGASQVEARFRNTSGTAYDILFDGLVLDEWNHFAFTYDGTKTQLYHNGTLVGTKTATGTMGNPGLDFMIGAIIFSDHTAFTLEGSADEVGLWTEALTLQQVANLMICPPLGNEPNLVGYWNLNEASGTSTEDVSAGDHPGILLNGADWTTASIPVYNCPSVGIHKMVNAVPVSVYPNPMTTSTTIFFNKLADPTTIRIFDAFGKDVTPTGLGHSIHREETLNMERGAFNSGIYFIHICTEKETITQKLIVGN